MCEVSENIQSLKRSVSIMEACDGIRNGNVSRIALKVACQETSKLLDKIRLQVEDPCKIAEERGLLAECEDIYDSFRRNNVD
jgi:hypothetical protein